jgi:hypothetical protein
MVIAVLLLQLTVLFVGGPIAGGIAPAEQQDCSGRAIVGKRLNRQEKARNSGRVGGRRA